MQIEGIFYFRNVYQTGKQPFTLIGIQEVLSVWKRLMTLDLNLGRLMWKL